MIWIRTVYNAGDLLLKTEENSLNKDHNIHNHNIDTCRLGRNPMSRFYKEQYILLYNALHATSVNLRGVYMYTMYKGGVIQMQNVHHWNRVFKLFVFAQILRMNAF